jgi:tetratricopeptide (TPR) repeat protein
MGGAYSKLKKYRKAIKAYEKAIKIKPGYYEAHYSMGFRYACSSLPTKLLKFGSCKLNLSFTSIINLSKPL